MAGSGGAEEVPQRYFLRPSWTLSPRVRTRIAIALGDGGLAMAGVALVDHGRATALNAVVLLLLAAQYASEARRTATPLVELDREALVWRQGFTAKRYPYSDLSLDPDPFDVTVIRLRTSDGGTLRIPRDQLTGGEELESRLTEKIEACQAP